MLVKKSVFLQRALESIPWKGATLRIKGCRRDTPLAPTERIRAEPKFTGSGVIAIMCMRTESVPSKMQPTTSAVKPEGIKVKPNSTTSLLWSTMAVDEKETRFKIRFEFTRNSQVNTCCLSPEAMSRVPGLMVDPHAVIKGCLPASITSDLGECIKAMDDHVEQNHST